MKRPGTTLALCGALGFACASPPSTDSAKLDPALEKLVLSAVPADVPNPTFVDFGGKVHLVGWDVSPKDSVAFKGTLSLKLYWRSASKVNRGYHLATRLTAANGKVYHFDDVGPLRQLAPSDWVPGMVYVDEQELVLPEEIDGTMVALSVGVSSELYAPGDAGVEKVGDFGLKVLSGLSDGQEGAELARIAVGQRPKSAKPGMDRRPAGMPFGRLPLGRPPSMDKEKAP